MVPVAALGALLYTLAEYWYHRYIAHQWLDRHMLETHHAVPDNYFAAPWPLIVPVAALLWLAAFAWLGTSGATAFMVGVSACHLWQELVHFIAHHVQIYWSLALHHNMHHYDETRNFGHSTTLWDHVFNTKA